MRAFVRGRSCSVRTRAQAAKEEARQAYKASVVAAKKKAEETEESRLRQARESAPLVATRGHRLSRLPTERGQLPLHLRRALAQSSALRAAAAVVGASSAIGLTGFH